MESSYPFFLGNRPVTANRDLPVLHKYDGQVATQVALADRNAVLSAIASAESASAAMRELPAYEREAILQHCVQRFTELREQLAQDLCIEAGKPIRDCRGEVARLIDTFKIAAAETTQIGGELVPLDLTPRAKGYTGLYQRFPIGPCSFITPFNFPLNLVAHKVAPAIAAGCPFVLKPATQTPVGALTIASILAETDLPPGAFSVIPCRIEDADPLVEDPRLRLLSFTGSPEVGWRLKARAGRKKVVLELGGNAGCILDADTDISDAVARVTVGAFSQSGQSCISVQRVLVHASIYDEFRARMITATAALRCGDPANEDTIIGPLISTDAAERLHGWIHAAIDAGATLLCGGGRDGAMLEPTLLEDVPAECDVVCREAFGPVAVLSRFTDFTAALREVDSSDFGLQAGVFTRDLHRAWQAFRELEVGGVVIGDVPSWRADNMPYGGVKQSGIGREGVRYAIQDMTEMRMLVLRGR